MSKVADGNLHSHPSLLFFYVVAGSGVQMTQTIVPDKYSDEAACLDAGETMKFVSRRDADGIKIGFVCVKTGTVEDSN